MLAALPIAHLNATMKISKSILTTLTALAPALAAAGADISFVGQSKEVLVYVPERNTGLDHIYVAYDVSEISEMRVAATGGCAISKYSNLGGGYAIPVDFHIDGSEAIVDHPEGDCGYIIEAGGSTEYIWIVDYRQHMLSFGSAVEVLPQDCDNTRLTVDANAGAIHYYSIDGRQCELDRDIEVAYNTLEWNDDAEGYVQTRQSRTLPHLTSTLTVTPPIYCNSVFDFSGDRFLAGWQMERHMESQLVYANGIAAHTTAEQTNEPDTGEDSDPSNMIKTEVAGIGGSAPVDMTFRAWVTDAVAHTEWQIAADEMFENIDYRFTEQNLDYSFTEEGTYYVRFVASNSDGSCETYGDTYTIGVGSSDLRIPNAFTPNDDGINDVWKVAYRSLLSFSCTIFDRYGTQIYHFTDPSKGWDGRYKGKLVKPGVYFYVIEAKGADGRSYKKGGDINIIKSKKYSNNEGGGGSSVE